MTFSELTVPLPPWEYDSADVWKPIKTAPRDGTEVLVFGSRAGTNDKMVVAHYMPGGHCIEDHPPIAEGWYYCCGGAFQEFDKPTHWRPLPQPPEKPND